MHRLGLVLAICAIMSFSVGAATTVTITNSTAAERGGAFIRAYYENANAPVTGCSAPCLTVDTQTTQPTAIVSAPALDGSNFAVTASGTATTIGTTLTTTKAPDVIMLLTTTQVSTGYVTVSSISATGLTFAKRTSTTAVVGGYDMDFEEWYAIASSTLGSLSITVTYSGTITHYGVLNVFGVRGAYTSSPFDSNAGLPSVRTQAAASISTNYSNDFLFGFELTIATASPTAGGGWSTINTPANDYFGSEYQQVSSTQSALAATWSNAATDADVMLGDAIQASNSFTLSSGSTAYLWSPQFSSATTISAGTWALDLWAEALSYVPVTITNNQATATPNPLQVKITWNPSTYSSYEGSSLGNVRFCSDVACNTKLSAWLESCTPSCSTSATSASAWVKLTSVISASGGTLTVYMVFLDKATQFDGNFWGEAPNLSGTYGQYDNGANVFTFYDNFAGTTLNSTNWGTTTSGGGASYTVNNGITFTTNTGSDWIFIWTNTAFTFPNVAEARLLSITSGNPNPMLGVSTTTSVDTWHALYAGYELDWAAAFCTPTSPCLDFAVQTSTGGTALQNPTSSFNSGTWSVIWSATGSEVVSDGVTTLTGTDNRIAIGNYHEYLGVSDLNAGSLTARWSRVRAYPPSNVMPSTSFGAVSSGRVSVTVSVTDSTGATVTMVASNVQSPLLAAGETEYTMTFAGVLAAVPANGYISVTIVASTDTCTIFWGAGQPTNFQVTYTVRTT